MASEADVKTGKPLTEARERILQSARLSPPAAWIVEPRGGRVGFEAVAWNRNCHWLAANGYMYANAHGDYTLTEEGERVGGKRC